MMKIVRRDNGVLPLAVELLAKYGLGQGDSLTLLDLGDDTFLLTTATSHVPALVAQMEAIRIEAGITLDDLLSGAAEQRCQLYQERVEGLDDRI